MKTLPAITLAAAALLLSGCEADTLHEEPSSPSPAAVADIEARDHPFFVAMVREHGGPEARVRTDDEIVADGYVICRAFDEDGPEAVIYEAYDLTRDDPDYSTYFTALIPMAAQDLCPEYYPDYQRAITDIEESQ